MNLNAIAITVFVVAAAVAFVWDLRSWKRKPCEELVRMLESKDWRGHGIAIKELRRRGEDVTVYIPRIVALLVSDAKMERAAAFFTLKDCFPELASKIAGFSPTAGIEACRAKTAPLLARFVSVR